MSSEAARHLKHLAVFRDSNPTLKKAILQNCDQGFIDAIAEICLNYLRGNINCTRKQYLELAKHKDCLRNIVNQHRQPSSVKKRGCNKKLKRASQRDILMQKGDGFWLALLPVVSELATYFMSKALEK